MQDQQPIQTLAEGKFLHLLKRGRWEYAARPSTIGAVAVIATTDDDELLLIEQYRVPLGKPCIELPAGLAGDDGDPGEAATTAARRELFEETGYTAQHITPLVAACTSPGLTNESIELFRATGLTRINEGGGTEHEDITVHRVPVAQLSDWLNQRTAEGTAIDMKTLAAIAMLNLWSFPAD